MELQPGSFPDTVPEAMAGEDGSSHRLYLRSVFGLVFGLLLGCGLLNIGVDPYLRFGSPRVAAVSQLKPLAIKQVRMAKAYEVHRQDYLALLLGNSRVDVGLDPQCAAFPASWCPVYNLGQPGTGSGVALQYLEHALAHHRPEHVLIGMDFMNVLKEPQFLEHPQIPPPNPRLRSSSPVNWAHRNQVFQDALTASLSLSAVTDSLRTLTAQRDSLSANLSAQGFNSGEAFRKLIRIEGQAALFEQKNAEYAERCWRRVSPVPEESTELKSWEQLLKRCQQERIEVRVFIHPYHADVLEIFDGTQHWEEFENWKRTLAATCAEQGIPLWDFAVFNEITTEKPPATEDRTTVMQWYWESGHYRSTLGDRMLAQMLAPPLEAMAVGVRIDRANVEMHLAEIRRARSGYRQAHPKRRELILELVRSKSRQARSQ